MTVGTLSFYPTANTILNAAMRLIRAYDSAQTPGAQQTTDALEALNFLLTSWQTLGLQLWCIKTSAAQTPVLSQTVYTVGTGGGIAIARPLQIIKAYLRDTTDDTDVILNPLAASQYASITNKTVTGTPNSYYYDAAYGVDTTNFGATSKANLFLWPAADANTVSTKRLYLVYQRPFIDFDLVGDSIDMPQEWFNALKWNLAAQIMPEYGLPFMDQDRIRSQAKYELEQCLGWDAEKTSLTISPDPRMGHNK